MSHYAATPAFSPDVDIVYFEEEQLYRARVQSHGRGFDIERGSRDEVMRELEHEMAYEYELLMRFIDPDGLSQSTFQSAMREGAYTPEIGLDVGAMLTAGLGINAALCVIMPSPGLIKDALHVAKRFGGSFSSRAKSRKGSRVARGIGKRCKFAAVVGGVTVVARSRRGLRKKVSQRKMHTIHIIMNAVRTQRISQLKNKRDTSPREAYTSRSRDLPELADAGFRTKVPEKTGDWRSRAGGHRMRLIDKCEEARGLY